MPTRYWTRDDGLLFGSNLFPFDVNGMIRCIESTPARTANDTCLRVFLDVQGAATIIQPTSHPIDGWWARMQGSAVAGVYDPADPNWPVGLGTTEPNVILTGGLKSEFSPGVYTTNTNTVMWYNHYPLESRGMRRLNLSAGTPVVRASMGIINTPDGIGGAPHHVNDWQFMSYLRVLWQTP